MKIINLDDNLGDRQLQGKPAPYMRPGQRATIFRWTPTERNITTRGRASPGQRGVVQRCCRRKTRPGNYVKVVQRIP